MSWSFTEGAPTKQFESSIEQEMTTHIKHLEKELTKVRTGRAHPAMVEDIRVACYGSYQPLKDLASISTPEPQLIAIQPWDASLIADIEKAISQSDLGVNPINDGKLIRISLPRMSSDRRDDLMRSVAKRTEEAKVAIRNIRKDVHNAIRETEKDKKISQDYSKRLQDALQKITDKCAEMADVVLRKKETEIKSL